MRKLLEMIKLNRPDDQNHGKALFLAFLLFYVAIQILFHVSVITERHLPYGLDDAYAYMLKAPQMAEGCFLQDCKALADLEQQFSVAQQDPDKDWARYRVSGRSFVVYHPLHSVILWGVHSLGFGWELAYDIVMVGMAILLALGVGFFLYQLWGSKAAAVALLFLSATQFAGQGLHYIVPSNMALMVAFFCWASILRWREKSAFAVVFFVLAMLGFHPVGKLYAALSLILLFCVDQRRISFRTVVPYILVVLTVILSVALPYLVTAPRMTFETEPGTHSLYFEGLRRNFEHAYFIVTSWDYREYLRSGKLGLIISATGLIGMTLLQPIRRKQAMLVIFLFASLAGVSLFVVLPKYPAEVFQRVWCILAVVISGGVGVVAIKLIDEIKTIGFETKASRILSVSLIIVAVGATGYYLAGGAMTIVSRAKMLQTYDNCNFNEKQVDMIKKQCGTVYYAAEASLVYFLTHGVFDCPSVYLPGLDNPKAEIALYKTKPEPALIAANKPSEEYIRIEDKNNKTSIINNGAKPYEKIWLSFKSKATEGHLLLQVGEHVQKIDLSASIPLWISAGPMQVLDEMKITLEGHDGPVYLQGINVGEARAYQWPWGEKLTLKYSNLADYVFHFDAENLTHGVFKDMKILDEGGASLLAIGSFSATE